MEEIRKLDSEAFNVLEEANVDEETLLSFSRDDLKDLFDGRENFLLRRKIWIIIEKNRECNSEIEQCLVTPKKEISQGQWKSLATARFLPIVSTTSSRNSSPTSSMSESSVCIDIPEQTNIVKPQQYPAFIVYSDSELSHAVQTGSLSSELLNRLVRNTISNMRAACQSLPIAREPTTLEIEEMARALCNRYLCIEKRRSDDGKTYSCITTEERLKLTDDERNKLHYFLFTKLKKRWCNVIPPKRPQGKVPGRSNKRFKSEMPEPAAENLDLQLPSHDNIHGDTDKVISARHYSALDKEQRKVKPNKCPVNKYLNMEFNARRRFLEETKKESRPNQILEAYPCFKDPNEVVEEVRRSLSMPEEKDTGSFMEKCVNNLATNLDTLIYYGISKNALRAPRGQSVEHKILHLMKGINAVFKSKAKVSKQKGDIIHFIEHDEQPDHWQQKRHGFIPGLVITRADGAMVLLGKDIFLVFKDHEIANAVVAFLASFYLLDLDYPACWLTSLSVLQRIIFKDNKVHPDSQGDVIKALEELELFCKE